MKFWPLLGFLGGATLVGSTGYLSYDLRTFQRTVLTQLDSLEKQLTTSSAEPKLALASHTDAGEASAGMQHGGRSGQEPPISAADTLVVGGGVSEGEATPVGISEQRNESHHRELKEARETLGLLTRQIAELQQELHSLRGVQATLDLRDRELLALRVELEAARQPPALAASSPPPPPAAEPPAAEPEASAAKPEASAPPPTPALPPVASAPSFKPVLAPPSVFDDSGWRSIVTSLSGP